MLLKGEKIEKIFIIAMLCGLPLAGLAQQLPVYSQYMMNKFLINPAIAGSEGYTSFNLTTRKQWLGLNDAPFTFAASGQTRILRNSFINKNSKVRLSAQTSSRDSKVGVGGYVFADRNGLVGRTGLQLTYAYHISMDRSQLSFGFSGTLWQFRIDKQAARLFDPNDRFFNNMDDGMLIPDANLGVYYSSEIMYVGFSADQLFQSHLKFGGEGLKDYKLYRHYYLMGGYYIELSEDVMLVPSVLLKTTQQLSFQMDLTATAYFREQYWAGLTYRTSSTIVIMGGVKVDKFYFGYALDLTLGSLMSHNYGTHEIMIAMKFGDNARRYKWLNRY